MPDQPQQLKVTLTLYLRALPDPEPGLVRWDLALKQFLTRLRRTYGLVCERLIDDCAVLDEQP